MDVIKKSLSEAELQKICDAGARLEVVVEISLSDLIDLGLDELNDFVEEIIIGTSFSACLMDIGYEVVGHVPATPNGGIAGGSVLLKVNAAIDCF